VKWRGGVWRPRSKVFMIVDLALAWMALTYGLNLIREATFHTSNSASTYRAIESIAPLHVLGWALIAGAVLLTVGISAHLPHLAIAGHLIAGCLFVALGIPIARIDSLNQIALVLGGVLHPVMAVTLASDWGRAQGAAALADD
jgi:hypothetical protein